MTHLLAWPFTMLVTHPGYTLAGIGALYATCYLPALVTRRKGR